MPTIRAITAEATAICKGVEMTHGNSEHFLTFELDSGERIYFQVSMKCYMLIVEGDRCLITYKSYTNSPKKKLKSFERIGKTTKTGIRPIVSTPVMVETADDDLALSEESLPIQFEPYNHQEINQQPVEQNEPLAPIQKSSPQQELPQAQPIQPTKKQPEQPVQQEQQQLDPTPAEELSLLKIRLEESRKQTAGISQNQRPAPSPKATPTPKKAAPQQKSAPQNPAPNQKSVAPQKAAQNSPNQKPKPKAPQQKINKNQKRKK